MKQPYPSNGLREGGQAFRRRPIVLARLPHVDVATGSVSPPVAHAAAFRKNPSQEVNRQAKFFVDPQHVSAVAPEHFAAHESLPSAQVELLPQSRRHDRHHATNQESQHDESHVIAQQPSTTAAGLVRLHELVASASSSIVTLALIVAVVLMVWMIATTADRAVDDLPLEGKDFGVAAIEIPNFSIAQDSEVDRIVPTESTTVADDDDLFEPAPADSQVDLQTEDLQTENVHTEELQAENLHTEENSWDDAFRAAQDDVPSKPVIRLQEVPAELIRLPLAEDSMPFGPIINSSDPSILSFPVTSYSESLDFSRLDDFVEDSIAEEVPAAQTKQLPALFQRPAVQ